MAQLREWDCPKEGIAGRHVGNHQPPGRRNVVIGHEAGHEWSQHQEEHQVVIRRGEDPHPGDGDSARQKEGSENNKDCRKPVRQGGRDCGQTHVEAAVQDHVVRREEKGNQEKKNVKRKACCSHDWMGNASSLPRGAPSRYEDSLPGLWRISSPHGPCQAPELPDPIQDSQRCCQKAKAEGRPLGEVIQHYRGVHRRPGGA